MGRACASALLAVACSVQIDYGDPPSTPDASLHDLADAGLDGPPLPPDGAPDVTLTIGRLPAEVQDSEVNGLAPTDPYGALDHFSIDALESGLVRFELPSFAEGATVLSARLTVTTLDEGSPDGGNVLVYRLAEAWDEATATWEQRLPAVPWSAAGAEPPSRDLVVLAEIFPQSPETAYPVSLPPALVQGWVDDPSANFGVAIVRGTSTSHVHFRTTESGAGWPVLEIVYR